MAQLHGGIIFLDHVANLFGAAGLCRSRLAALQQGLFFGG
jgi:hypothetical protein